MFENITFKSCGKFVSRGEWIHPDRKIETYEIIFVTDGAVYINENGATYALEKNDLLLLSPNLRHFGFKKSSNTSFYWLHFSGEIKESEKCFNIENPYNISLLFRQALHYSAENRSAESLNYITRLILDEMQSVKKEKSTHLVNNVTAWINTNNDVMLTVGDVARHFGYNVDYLSRLIKKKHGISLKKYIDQTKIALIKNLLLNSNLTLTEIADSSGFADYKQFLKFFKYHEKFTPTEFCNLYSKKAINNR